MGHYVFLILLIACLLGWNVLPLQIEFILSPRYIPEPTDGSRGPPSVLECLERLCQGTSYSLCFKNIVSIVLLKQKNRHQAVI